MWKKQVLYKVLLCLEERNKLETDVEKRERIKTVFLCVLIEEAKLESKFSSFAGFSGEHCVCVSLCV